MPTLAGDVQAVLADEKVLFQNQEIAFVVAEDRYIAADAVELVEVEYEELPVIVDPTRRWRQDAPMLREDLKDKTDGAHGKRKHHNHIFTWEVGDKAGDRRGASPKAEVTAKELIVYQRVHPCPLETCACVASMDKIKGELTVWGTFQAPHVDPHGRLADLRHPGAQDPCHLARYRRRLRQQGRRLSRLFCAIVASIVLGVPVKWVEDRIENLSTTAFARDYHMTGEIAATKDGRITATALPRARRSRRLRRLRRPDQIPRRLLQHLHRLLRHPGRPSAGRRRLYQQGAGRRRLSLLVPRHRGVLFHRAAWTSWRTSSAWTRPRSASRT